jgi:carboxyl-terminal processing protease
MLKRRKILQGIFTVLVIISFFVTAVVGVFLVTNYYNIGKMARVGAIIKKQYLGDVSVEQMMEGAVRGMVESLDDPYSIYMNKEEYKEFYQHIEGSIGGIGVSVAIKEGKFVVYSVISGTPAFKAGVLKGDIIFKVNDKLTGDMQFEETINKMRGEPGTPLQLTVLREGNLKEFTLYREKIEVPTVESKVLADQIGYLRLTLFAGNSDEALVEHLDKLKEQKIKGLVLDLRDNPGGDMETAVNIAKYFVPEGPILYVLNKNGTMDEVINEAPVELGIPLTVLINGYSASASEILAGAIKDTKSGILIGEKSFGKALVQVLVDLGHNEAMKLTTAKYLTPNKHDIQAKGILPDYTVEFKEDDKEDLQLNKALEVVKKQIK